AQPPEPDHHARARDPLAALVAEALTIVHRDHASPNRAGRTMAEAVPPPGEHAEPGVEVTRHRRRAGLVWAHDRLACRDDPPCHIGRMSAISSWPAAALMLGLTLCSAP